VRKEKLDELNNYISELKTLEKKLLMGESKFLSAQPFQCRLNNGKLIVREKLIKGKGDGSAAIILPLTHTNNVVLVVEPRVFTKETVGVGFPAGYVEAGEDPKVAALRELREECGYVAEDMILLDKCYQDEGCSAAYNHIYLATQCIPKYDQQLDKDEYIRYFECTLDETYELESMGYIKGANAKLALAAVKTYMRGR
jgi:ADP-ribose pyrophosphatase